MSWSPPISPAAGYPGTDVGIAMSLSPNSPHSRGFSERPAPMPSPSNPPARQRTPSADHELGKAGLLQLPERRPSLGSLYTEATGLSRLTMTQSVRGSVSSTSPPPSTGHGHISRQRRFASRHVPDAAEDLVYAQVLTTDMVSRFNGLMRHLKNNTEWDEQQKQVMVSHVEALVPEEYEETLQSEFERRCSFGDRMNTELMSSAKWVRLLRDCGAVTSSVDVEKRGRQAGRGDSLGSIKLPEADVIFLKVLHDCDYGGKRLSYDLFCKALYLVSRACRPDLSGEAAFTELIARIVAVAPEDDKEEKEDLMLDANVVRVLDYYKPALFDMFHSFCNRNLGNVSDGSPGSGTIRLSERTYWKHTQDTMMSGYTTMRGTLGGTLGGGSKAGHSLNRSGLGISEEAATAASASPRDNDATSGVPNSGSSAIGSSSSAGPVCPPVLEGADMDDKFSASEEDHHGHGPDSGYSIYIQNAEADAGGGYAELRPLPRAPASLMQAESEPIHEEQLQPPWSQGRILGGPLTASNTMVSVLGSQATQDPYLYANGAPVIKNRRRHMSLQQMYLLCKELQIIPDLLSRTEVTNIFKRAQCAGAHSSHGSSKYGYLNAESFIDATGQCAIEAYSKSPFSEEYPDAHEKVHAFLMNILPRGSREAKERFLWGAR